MDRAVALQAAVVTSGMGGDAIQDGHQCFSLFAAVLYTKIRYTLSV
jgi:hypothetical protein